MKIYDIKTDIDYQSLAMTDLENFFNVHVDSKGNYIYNLNATICFDGDQIVLPTYTLKHPMHWPLVSYKIYGTTRLAWALMKANNVKADAAMDKLSAGTVVSFIPTSTMQAIVTEINGY